MNTIITGLSVVIPMHNEADNAAALIQEVQAALTGVLPFEIIAVNDCSRDDTGAVLATLAKTEAALRIITHPQNQGQSTSVLTGVRHARYPWVATLDGDGQNNPADIPAMLRAATHPLILVAGVRQARQDSWLKKISSRIANAVRRALLKDDCPDTGCGLKLFHRDTFLYLPAFNHLHRYLPALFRREGGGVTLVPVSHRARQYGVSNYGTLGRLQVGIVDLIGVMWLIRRPCRALSLQSTEQNEITQDEQNDQRLSTTCCEPISAEQLSEAHA